MLKEVSLFSSALLVEAGEVVLSSVSLICLRPSTAHFQRISFVRLGHGKASKSFPVILLWCEPVSCLLRPTSFRWV